MNDYDEIEDERLAMEYADEEYAVWLDSLNASKEWEEQYVERYRENFG